MRIRKAILTGGGRATRLHPITTTINKHLLPLANKPMIFHAIEKAVEAGIEEIYINTNPGEDSLRQNIGDGGHWGIKIKFFEQTGGPQGIAHVVKQAERFIGDDPFMFYLSDNVLLGGVVDMVKEFNSGNHDCMLALSKVNDPERFGVPVFDDSGRLVDVWEKPDTPPNNYAVTGIYIYGPEVFFEAYENIEKSDRGEYEISSIHSHFLKTGKKVGYKEITGWWKDTGKPADLLIASKLLLDKFDFNNNQAQNYDNCDIKGNVEIGIGTKIAENVKIIGPVIIGANCVLEDCTIGPYVSLGQGSTVKKAKINDSIILENANIDCEKRIFESLIGKGANLVKRSQTDVEGHKMIIGDKTIIEI
ncbi:MAG: glucose-1-phosphate thymidylyltransferase [Candidatus Magasanikbacteria bacterium]|nr:glucose-1-phosphate thymidylyltransferase [Candidatus Magasanikbacteria bacterium]